MYGLVAPCYRLIQNISYKKHLSLLLRFFFLPFLIFFKIFSLVAVCLKRIHHCLYILPFVTLVTLFVSIFLFFFSMYSHVAVCHRMIQDISYTNHLSHLFTHFFSDFKIFFFTARFNYLLLYYRHMLDSVGLYFCSCLLQKYTMLHVTKMHPFGNLLSFCAVSRNDLMIREIFALGLSNDKERIGVKTALCFGLA